MSRSKRFRRLSALTSVLLASTSTIALAQGSAAQRKVPTTKEECDQLSSDLLFIAADKTGDGFTDYLRASNVDRSLPQLCAEGKYQAAYDIAVAEIAGFEKPSEPSRVPESTLRATCEWDGNNGDWSASAGAGDYTLAMFAKITEFDPDFIQNRGSRFTMDSREDVVGTRYRLEVPLRSNHQLKEVDVELSVDGGEPRRARVPIIFQSWADITPLITSTFFAMHVAKVSAGGKPLMTATFQPSPPGRLGVQVVEQAVRLKQLHKRGGCVKRQCFLTTACCELIGLDDDCFELRALRAFRDNDLPSLPGGERDIALYYAAAPLILEAMRRAGSERALLRYYASHVLPCATLATLGFAAATQRLYRDLMRRLANTYVPGAAHLLDS